MVKFTQVHVPQSTYILIHHCSSNSMATLHPYSGDLTKRIINQSLGSRDWHQRHLIPPRSIHSLALTYLVLQICKYIFHLMSSRLKFCAWALHSVFVKNLTVKVALWTKVNLCHILLQWSCKIPEDRYSRQKLYANIIPMSQCKSTSLKGIYPSPNVLCLTAIAQILKERQDPMCPWRFCTGHNAPEAKNQWDDVPLMFLYQVLVTILIKWYLRF